MDNEETVPIRWQGPGAKGRGRRRLGRADGLSKDYEWQGVGSAIDVARVDAPKIMLLAKAGTMAYVNPEDAKALAQVAEAMTAPAPKETAPAHTAPAAEQTPEPDAKAKPDAGADKDDAGAANASAQNSRRKAAARK